MDHSHDAHTSWKGDWRACEISRGCLIVTAPCWIHAVQFNFYLFASRANWKRKMSGEEQMNEWNSVNRTSLATGQCGRKRLESKRYTESNTNEDTIYLSLAPRSVEEGLYEGVKLGKRKWFWVTHLHQVARGFDWSMRLWEKIKNNVSALFIYRIEK